MVDLFQISGKDDLGPFADPATAWLTLWNG
jgi:hypothetical protein